jgi:UDP-glucose 4-epimerase
VKHVLITGGAGFIGSHLAEALLARGNRVTVIDDQSTGSVANLAGVQDHFDFMYRPGSAADKNLLRDTLPDVDEVYHLAAAVGVQLLAAAPIHAIEDNVYPTEMLLSELHRRAKNGHRIKLFLASSCEVYGKNRSGPWSEDDDLVFGPPSQPRWSYGVAHALDEYLALAYWREHKLPVVIGRFFNTVGSRQSGRFGMVLPRFVEAAVAGRPLMVHGDGQQQRCFAHVTDVARAAIELMETDAALAGVFNLGADEPVTILEVADKIKAIVDPRLEIQLQSYAQAGDQGYEDVGSRIPDLTRLRQTINFRPTYTLDSIIHELVSEARAKQWTTQKT